MSGPFHVRFNKGHKTLNGKNQVVRLKVNGKDVNILMKLGSAGEAFFIERTREKVLKPYRTSPISSPIISPVTLPEADLTAISDLQLNPLALPERETCLMSNNAVISSIELTQASSYTESEKEINKIILGLVSDQNSSVNESSESAVNSNIKYSYVNNPTAASETPERISSASSSEIVDISGSSDGTVDDSSKAKPPVSSSWTWSWGEIPVKAKSKSAGDLTIQEISRSSLFNNNLNQVPSDHLKSISLFQTADSIASSNDVNLPSNQPVSKPYKAFKSSSSLLTYNIDNAKRSHLNIFPSPMKMEESLSSGDNLSNSVPAGLPAGLTIANQDAMSYYITTVADDPMNYDIVSSTVDVPQLTNTMPTCKSSNSVDAWMSLDVDQNQDLSHPSDCTNIPIIEYNTVMQQSKYSDSISICDADADFNSLGATNVTNSVLQHSSTLLLLAGVTLDSPSYHNVIDLQPTVYGAESKPQNIPGLNFELNQDENSESSKKSSQSTDIPLTDYVNHSHTSTAYNQIAQNAKRDTLEAAHGSKADTLQKDRMFLLDEEIDGGTDVADEYVSLQDIPLDEILPGPAGGDLYESDTGIN